MKSLFLMGMLCLIANHVFSQEGDSLRRYELDEVVVATTRANTQLKNIPQKVEIIDKGMLQSLPSSNMADVLKTATNLDVIQYPGLSSTIGMRGFSPSAHARSYTLLLLNGNPLGTTNISCLDKDLVERVEVIKGPYSTLYGSDAMGGVINIITKKPVAQNNGSAEVGYGSYGNLKMSASVNGVLSPRSLFRIGFLRNEQRLDYRIGKSNALKLSEKGKLMLDKASFGDVMKNSTWQYNQLNGQYVYNISDSWSTGFDLIYFNANDIKTPGNYWGSYGQSKKDIDRINWNGTLMRKTQKSSLYFSPYFTREVNANYTDNSDTSFVSFNSDIREYGFKMHDNFSLGGFKVLAGADLDVYRYASDRFNGKASPINPYSPNHNNTKAALFSQVTYSKGGLDVNGGLRYNYISYHIEQNDSLQGTGGSENYQTVNPSLGLQYKLPYNLKLHGSYGTGFSVPDAFKVAGFYAVSEYLAAWDFWWVKNYMGNPDLEPESSSTIDLGLSYSTPNKFIFLDLTWFTTRHSDKIIETTLDSVVVNQNKVAYDVTTYKNANNSAMNGVELMASTNIGALFSDAFKLELYGNWTYMFNNTVDESFVSSAGKDSIVSRDLLYARKSNANFGVVYDNYKGFLLRLHGRYLGSRLEKDNFSKLRPGLTPEHYYTSGGYTAKDKILQHPEYLVFDFSVGYSVNSYRLGVTVSNLLNENYTEKDGYNMPGRMLMASYSYSF
ncbi:TonB-dependent receptor plug domain-containing protein [Xiashengella succiniciproducens]|jgi:vitamin B12 transporter|uniref:TonB-dependent receptor n=1 Tax=Xiashengella succiniciproducens TaxID=2949635 RepID=A0A9J6ZRY1_9BACT|nr:TonB-dependent receptor [Alkaliflexus sp. Ai-910]URW80447.1 TonB-dependent receptor [Alkaliflexus sp. Ai-910]